MDGSPTSETAPERDRTSAPIPFATRLDRSLIREMKIACVRRGITLQVGVAKALRVWIASEDRRDV